MTSRCDTCTTHELDDIVPPKAWRFLRRATLVVVIFSAAIALLLGEAWVIERAPVLFTAPGPAPTTNPARGFTDVLNGDAMPVAVLH